MTISVAKSGGAYVGFINSGREANLYYDNGFNTETTVKTAITTFNTKVDEIVTEIEGTWDDSNVYVARDVFLAKEVNNYLAREIKYDYAAYDNMDDPDYVAAAYINTPYGGLVEQKAVCGGFSTAYKVIMDKLGIPCITVNGYSNNRDENGNNSGTSVYHMWNYVYLEAPSAKGVSTFAARATANSGAWYSVDVTWDKFAYSITRYAVLSASVDADLHVTDGVISSGGYELVYPELSKYTYGGTVDADGLQLTITYEEAASGEDNKGGTLYNTFYHVSYNGKDAKRLFEEDGLFMAIRYAYYYPEAGQLEVKWTDWNAIEYWRLALRNGNNGQNDEDMIQNTGNETRFYGNTSEYYVQVAVFDTAPTRATPNGYEDEYPDRDPNMGKDPNNKDERCYFYYFSTDAIEETTAVAISDVEENLTYGTYTPPPYIAYDYSNEKYTYIRAISDSMRLGNSNKMNPKNAFTLSVKYDQNLHILDETKDIGISFTTVHPNTKDFAFFVPFEDGKYVHLLDDKRTLEFKFCPSLMYEHNKEDYHFFFTNVGSAELIKVKDENGNLVDDVSNKLPNSALYCFERRYMACPKMFNYDGRLWVDCCAQPQLVSNSDLSEDNFKDENGNSLFSEAERSQMMLVAERADTSTVDAMLDGIGDIEGSNVTKNDIKTSETYDIFLQMCNMTPTIPDGSYVKIALGFPQGYGPDDEGVTFKIYHRKHVKDDEYIIEEVPCVVTQFGIVACVNSFSPYMVAVVDKEFATTKNVYASIEGNGGKLTQKDGRIQMLSEGESYTYTIQPDEGYRLYTVTLNGVDVQDQIVDGKLTVNYNDLSSDNHLVIQYISNEAYDRIQNKIANNIIEEDVVVNATKYVVSLPTDTSGQNNYTAAIVIAVIVGVLAVAAAVTVIVVIRKKKN
ncbi:MAG: transglutaminase domain-containing protein, partial [Clostridia bacterium]|nr:transglutaminase domain-containing protein [Clostridia bacterium]